MRIDLAERLQQLSGAGCTTVAPVEDDEPGKDAIYAVGTAVSFSDGTRLSAQFWRLIKDRKPLVSIFDHRQKYGLPAPVDAIHMLELELVGNVIASCEMSATTGDLRFCFERDIELEVFNFTAFEIWELVFPDGSGELSNYALA
jgi:hypothetical protein